MNKITQLTVGFMRKFSIKSRVLTLLIVFSVIPVHFLAQFTSDRINGFYIAQENKYWNTSSEIIGKNLRGLIKQIDFCAFDVLNDYKIFSCLNPKSQLYPEKHSLIEKELSDIMSKNFTAKRITVVSTDNDTFTSDGSESNLDISMFSDVDNLPVMMQIPTLSLDNTDIVQVRTLIDFSTGIKYGYICIYVNNDAIFECYKDILSDADKCLIVDGQQRIIYGAEGLADRYLLSSAVPGKEEYSAKDSITEHSYYSKKIKIDAMPTLDWYLVCSFSNATLQNGIKTLNRIIFIFQCIVGLVSVLIVIRLSFATTKSIGKLSAIMVNYPSDNLAKHITLLPPNDELAFLETTLRNMISRIDSLMENIELNQKKQRELELQIMQAQINPHFIYNTLDSISCLALKNGQPEIRRIAVALTSFFRISLSKGNKYITVREELQHVKYYAEIEQFRANYTFNITYDIAPEIMDLKIIKIVLQPLVENSIRHGFNNTATGHINISGFMLDDKIHFEVADNGCGFDTSLFENDAAYTGFGCKNVNNRIKLEYGDECGLKYYSIPNKMTRAEVVLGYKKD